MYLSGKTNQFFIDPVNYGCMFSYKTTGRQKEALQRGCKWMLDNGAFSNNWIFQRWVYQLAIMLPYKNNCLGIVVPDVVYDSKATIQKFYKYKSIPEALGYKICFVSQDGLTYKATPWNDFDVLFIGGTDGHKRGIEAHELITHANKIGKYIHVGRLSSGNSIAMFATADSWDGTTFTRDKNNGNSEAKKMAKMTPVIKNIKNGTGIYRRMRLL